MIKVEHEWVNIYDLITIDKLAPNYKTKLDSWHFQHNEFVENEMSEYQYYEFKVIDKPLNNLHVAELEWNQSH